MTGMRKARILVAFVVLTAAGAVVIALPDSGPRLALSDAHGPGPLDAAGIVLAAFGSGLVWWHVWCGRASVRRVPDRIRNWWWFTAGTGLGLVVASVLADFAGWWAIGAGLITLVQITLFVAVDRQRKGL